MVVAILLHFVTLSAFSAAPASPETTIKKTVASKKPQRRDATFGLEFRFASVAKTASILAVDGGSSDVFLRTGGFDLCLRGSKFLTSSKKYHDFSRLCGGYHIGQLNSGASSTLPFSYVENDVLTVPVTFEPGIEVPVIENANLFITLSVRKLLVFTSPNPAYSLSNLTSIHYGIGAGFDAQIQPERFFTVGILSYFKNGFSFQLGYAINL